MLLNDRDLFGRHFNAEITASHHDSVGHIQNFFQVLEGLGFFQLGNDRDCGVVRCDDVFHSANIRSGANER